MATIQELMQAGEKAHAAGDTAAAKFFAEEIRRKQAALKTPSTPKSGQLTTEEGSKVDEPLSLKNNPISGVGEAALNMATGLVAKPISDVAGLTAKISDLVQGKGVHTADPEGFKNYVQSALTYEPKSSWGKDVAEYNPLALVGKSISAGAEGLAGLAQDTSDSELVGNLVRETALQGAGFLGAKKTPSQIPGVKAVGKTVSFLPETISNVMRPHTKKGLVRNAGLLMNKLAGERAPAVIAALEEYATAQPKAPGIRQETGLSAGKAATGAGSAEFSALQRLADSLDPSNTALLADIAADTRAKLLSNVTPDIALAKRVRSAKSTPHYAKSDKTVVALDPLLMDRLGDLPQGALNEAADIARMRGEPFQSGSYTPANIRKVYNPLTMTSDSVNTPATYPTMTGQALHDIKVASVERAHNPMLAGGEGAVSKASLHDLVRQIEDKIPEYKLGRKEFAKGSIPVNQAAVLGAIKDILDGQGGKERFSAFMNTMGRGEEALLKKVTKYGNVGSLESLLHPTQTAALQEVARQLTRDAKFKELSSAGTPKTTEFVGDFNKPLTLPSMLMAPVTLFNSLLGKFENAGRAKTMAEVARIMSDPVLTAKVMKAATPAERSILLKALNSKVIGGFGAQSAIASVPQDTENEGYQ